VEADETFRLLLSNPAGARLADGEGLATIRNDDTAQAVLPTLSVADASVAEGNGGAAPGYFSTSGNQIVDSAGQPVRIAAVSWFGMESETFTPHGLWVRNWQEMMGEIKAQGFNTIRLPFSSDVMDATTISGVDFGLNPDLRGLTGLQMMDKVVGEAGKLGLRIILDHHTASAARPISENGFWYDARHSETDWVNDWQALAARYANNPTVIGMDLHNEPWGATWADWDRAAERAGNAILAVNPDLLIIVEGVSQANGDSYWWGGNLQGVRDNPVTLNVPGKLVYSPHDYPNSIYPQSWFQTPNFGDTLYQEFDQNWGYIFRENIAPIWLGEFGTRMTDPKDLIWLDKITDYLNGDFDTNGTIDLAPGQLGQSWSWWSWNPNSTDTGGILQDDWRTVITAKVDVLKPMMFTFPDAGAGTPVAPSQLNFVVTLSEPAAGPVSVGWRTAPGSATARTSRRRPARSASPPASAPRPSRST
jgi:chitinase